MARHPKSRLESDSLWYKDAVIYQLHVKSFFDGNNDGIGDFIGLNAKLDYIASLGVNAVWLLPFYPSPRKDDGYDIAGYRSVSADFGALSDFKAFVANAHARGIRVITELVINHTSDQHPWFQRARKSPEGSSARNFYVWSNSDAKYPETRIIFVDTEKSNWSWDPVAGSYFWHRFYAHQPDLNFDNPRVMKEVLSVMRFWLDMGVDGLRLDAIPYLIEREGTSNENLPETHNILKTIRAEIDTHYDDRMLLAEANQWPEDTQLYFGLGDECHMAFHFPLMPRMYMAIAKEDRFPITDILRQTPEIPANSQWAIFLRNHDELTLEMVTDQERDYLWSTYASDPRARLNLGIRRRLAPLLDRDRRRIELMNGLLLSMPGTPIIYYGDELGMGDNLHLGDRDGVRTPMQWSDDRNGGFSRADPASVVLPPIMDSLYGFEAINVEAQAKDQHSLLNWMRRMLTLRRSHKVFGRGSLKFLYPRNRRILAYLREHEDVVILCVANLSRTPQAVELDLSAYAGRAPIEMTGPSPFPPIGQLTYLLTLPPYGFYWFQLKEANGMSPSWRDEPPEQLPDLQTLVVRDSLRELLGEHHSRIILHDLLPGYLQLRRWFASKNEKIADVSIAYAAQVPNQRDLLLTELEVTVGERKERYLVPAAIAWEGASVQPLAQQLAMARVRKGRKVGLITDAFALETLPRAIIAGLHAKTTFPTPDGEIQCVAEPGVETLPDLRDAAVRWLTAEQSNSSLILGNVAMVKLIRRVTPGVHPEAEMTRQLTACGYANAAELLGEIVRIDRKQTPHTLAIIQRSIPNQGDAWTWTLDNLKRALEDASLVNGSAGDHHPPFETLANFSAKVGLRLGELHVALSAATNNPAFAPIMVDEETVVELTKRTSHQIAQALRDLDRGKENLADSDQALASSVLADQAEVLAVVDSLARNALGTRFIRVHGDFHLGQILVSQSDAFIIDFEGEPLKALELRRAKSTPLRDVAGFLRSLDYAAASLELADIDPSSQPMRDRRSKLVDEYRRETASAFLYRYWETVANAPQLGLDSSRADLLDLMILEKASYEISYEAANRPKWLSIPLRGFAKIVNRAKGRERRI
jgi:maltose alpha-D-glucosyltransferase / alpha-amylase